MLQLADRLRAPISDHDCTDAVVPTPTQRGARFECPSCGTLFTEAVAA
jgi:predicted RNA-binding Zn-ribbon protein involved in translation (DUF1610 family)